jgi:transcriptional regulator with XRE-family HTH domain
MFASNDTERKETMGRRIASRRTLLGMTGGELAEAVGVTREWISTIERDRAANVSASTLMKIASTLGVTETWILRGDSAEAA